MNISNMAANAGLVISTPMLTPRIVVSANPFSKPAPANHSGSIATTVVKYAAKIIKNAFFSWSFRKVSSSKGNYRGIK